MFSIIRSLQLDLGQYIYYKYIIMLDNNKKLTAILTGLKNTKCKKTLVVYVDTANPFKFDISMNTL